jgi:uncharacterized membrane protein
MNEQEEIKQLHEELKQLHARLGAQQQEIYRLHQRLMKLGGMEQKPLSIPAPGARQWSLENFIGLRLIHLIGIVVLVIGLSIGVKYAIDRNIISETMRIALAYTAGVVLYMLSVRLKRKYVLFSAILFSGGMASLYFTTYGAYVYYGMMPFAPAFVIMIWLTLFTVYQAMVYSRQEIALLGLVGAYAIPFLISRNANRADLFFLYISVINMGVVYLCAKKPWSMVGRMAQVITWILFIGWASMRFDAKQQWVGLVFMGGFFLLFLFHSVSYKIFQGQKLSRSVVYQMILNSIALYVAALFVSGYSLNDADLALITLVVSAVAALQAAGVYYFWREEEAKRMMAALSFVLFIVFIAFQWEGLAVTLLWLLVAVLVFVLGAIKKYASLRMASIVLMGATLFKLVLFDSLSFSTLQKLVSYLVLGVLLLVVSYFYQKFKEQLFNKE